MGKITNALKGCALSLDKQKAVVRLDAEMSDQQRQIQELQAKCLQLEAVVNPLMRELAAYKEKLELLLAPKHQDANFPEHSSAKPRPRVIMGRPNRRG